MTYSNVAPQYRGRHTAYLPTPHKHTDPRLPKSPIWCDRDTAARQLSNDQQQLVHQPCEAIAVNVSVLAELKACGCTRFRLLLQSGKKLHCWLEDFYGPDSFFVERGYGEQRALPLRCMKTRLPEAVQPDLFAEVQP